MNAFSSHRVVYFKGELVSNYAPIGTISIGADDGWILAMANAPLAFTTI